MDCPNIEFLDDRTVNVKWNDTTKSSYLSTIIVYITGDVQSMLDITQKASLSGISIDNIKTLVKGKNTMIEVDLWVKSLEHLNNFIRDLKNLKYINNVERVMK